MRIGAGLALRGGLDEEGRTKLREAAEASASPKVRVVLDDKEIGFLDIKPATTWDEPSLVLPQGLPAEATLMLEPVEGEWTDYHVWIVGSE